MTGSAKSGLMGCLFAALAFIAFAYDKDTFGYMFFMSSSALLCASYICEAIEKRATPTG